MKKRTKPINIRYSLMKCRRRPKNSGMSSKREYSGYSTRERGVGKTNGDLNMGQDAKNVYKSTLEPDLNQSQFNVSEKSRTAALSSGITSQRKSAGRNRHRGNKGIKIVKNTISDVTIYCPSMGIISK